MEIWKEAKYLTKEGKIIDWSGLYEISSKGNIRSIDRDIVYADGRVRHYNGKTLLPTINRHGYKVVNIQNKVYPIHRILASTFIPNPENLPEINHKDEIRHNSVLENIEWCSHKYNNAYGTKGKRHSKKMKGNTSACRSVIQETKEGVFIAEYSSLKEAGKQFGKSHSNISLCCSGKQKTAYGYIWKYKE